MVGVLRFDKKFVFLLQNITTMDGTLLSKLTYIKELVHQWEFINLEGHGVRVYYKPEENKGMGFSFYAVDFVGCNVNEATETDPWEKDNCFVQGIYFGKSFWDGMRHLYMGMDDNDAIGYCYCPNLETHIQILKALQRLEKEYCRDTSTPL